MARPSERLVHYRGKGGEFGSFFLSMLGHNFNFSTLP